MSYETTFDALRNMIGRPTLRCIQAKANWTSDIPSGYSFDADFDRYMDSGGNVWTPTTSELPYNDVAFLPSSGNELQELMAAGLVESGDKSGRVLPGNIATVTAAEFCVIDSEEYNVIEATPFPSGAALWYRIQLRKR